MREKQRLWTEEVFDDGVLDIFCDGQGEGGKKKKQKLLVNKVRLTLTGSLDLRRCRFYCCLGGICFGQFYLQLRIYYM